MEETLQDRVREVLTNIWMWQKRSLKAVCPFGFSCNVCSDMFPELDRDEHDCPCKELGPKAVRARLETILYDFQTFDIFFMLSYGSANDIIKSADFVRHILDGHPEFRARKATGSGLKKPSDKVRIGKVPNITIRDYDPDKQEESSYLHYDGIPWGRQE